MLAIGRFLVKEVLVFARVGLFRFGLLGTVYLLCQVTTTSEVLPNDNTIVQLGYFF